MIEQNKQKQQIHNLLKINLFVSSDRLSFCTLFRC